MKNGALVSATDLSIFSPGFTEKISGPLSFEVRTGECLVIRGPNGSGKTTLLRCLLGQHRFTRGRLDIHVEPEKIGALPQLSNVRFHLPLTLEDVLSISQPQARRASIDQTALAMGLLEPASLARAWDSASGGERQRTLLTRLFLSSPQLVLLDEPGNHLDRGSRALLGKRLKAFLEEDPATRGLIMVTHEDEIFRALPHRELVLAEIAK